MRDNNKELKDTFEVFENQSFTKSEKALVQKYSNDLLSLVKGPFTWQWVAQRVVGGLLQGLGAKIFSEVFGRSTGDTSSPSIDLLGFMRQLLINMRELVRDALSDEALRKVIGQLESLETYVEIYNIEQEEQILNDAIRKASDVNSELKSLGYIGVHNYLTSFGLLIALYQEKLTKFNKPGYKNLIISSINQFLQHLEEISPQWSEWNKKRNIIDCIRNPVFPDLGYIWRVYRQPYDKDFFAIFSDSYGGPKKAKIKYQEFIVAGEKEVLEEHIKPTKEIAKEWIKLRDSL